MMTPHAMDCDLLVIGSGAGGLATATTAAHLGLKVIVAEKDPQFGGTTAWSGGWMWIPRNPLARAAGLEESIDGPLQYLRHELGAQFDEARVLAFLANGPRMVEFFRQHTALQFIDGNAIPDFHGNAPGAGVGGRSLCAAPFDIRHLGARMHELKPPLREISLWGMGIASGAELRHFFNATHQPASLWYVGKRVLRHAIDLLRYRRGTRAVNGNALVAALAASALDKGVDILTASPAVRLILGAHRIEGAVLATPKGEVAVRARCGVVLASGGFPHDLARQRELLPQVREGHGHWSAAHRGNTGDGLRLGEAAGGRVATLLAQPMALAPVSLVPRPDGSTGHFPHLIERAKPGVIAVRSDGLRFCNEADSYHDVMQALLKVTPAGEAAKAWLVCDRAFIRRYGLGAVKPAPFFLGGWLANRYLRQGRTPAELAAACGIDAQALEDTIKRYNLMAIAGHDTDFAKGQTPYNRIQGDAASAYPNPCMAPLKQGQFYAVQIVMGSLGSFAGLCVNAQAQVIGANDQPVPGLYAAGNDMSSLMGGHYPSGGITLGPAMTFGYVAAHHAAQRPLPLTDSPH